MSKISQKSELEQVDVVAEFHAHRISPARIAYRTGIDRDFVEALVEGSIHEQRFQVLLKRHRQRRREQRLKHSLRQKGIARSELQQQINEDFKLDR